MAARRLLIIMLVLLGISSVIAIALPNPDREPGSGTSGVTGETGSAGATGLTGPDRTTGSTGENGDREPVVAEGREDGESGKAGSGKGVVAGRDLDGTPTRTVGLGAGKPVEIEAKAGTRLILTVTSKTPSEVEIEGLGLDGFADPFAPAVFDLLLPEEPGKYRVRVPGKKPAALINTRA